VLSWLPFGVRSVTFLLCTGVAAAGCVPRLSRPERSERSTLAAAAEYPGEIRDPATVAGDFTWQQHVTSTFPGGTASGMVVVEKAGRKLTAVGLTPFGSRAFVLEQDGQRLTFTRLVDVEARLEPRVMLVDINRAFLLRAGEGPRPDGVHAEERRVGDATERVTERWKAGRLLERAFERPSGPAGRIVVRYEGGMSGFTPPRIVTLENGWYGYTLRIETVHGGEP
jgi:hypothetical protein